jgi:putative intracellular protease/amidase
MTASDQAEQQTQAFVDAMKPRHAERPSIAVVASNGGTETNDFLLPHALLQRAGVADVHTISSRRGIVELFPTLQVRLAEDFATFDRMHPSGPDYVIVPAMRHDDDPAVIAWIARQAERGARIIGVCAGALVLGRAGLLDGRRFATHWYYRKAALRRHPRASFVANQRYVVDCGVATTTGITASVPTTLALVEAIGGAAKARALAEDIGQASWSPSHDSSRFVLTAARRWDYVTNKLAFWRRERWSVDVCDGMDDLALALAADAWSRTGLVSVEASAPGPVKLRSGLELVARATARDATRMPLDPAIRPMEQLDGTLCEIGDRFGAARRDWVMMELEYVSSSGSDGAEA